MRKALLWALAVIITVLLAIYQRITGPTYPIKGEKQGISYKLLRSHTTGEDACLRIKSPYNGWLEYRRHKTSDPWTKIPMKREGEEIIGCLPSQPPAGKLDYMVFLDVNGKRIALHENPVVIRFKGKVPAWILILHIIAIFMAMAFATRAGLEAIFGNNLKPYVLWTFYLFLLGAFVLGPAVQKYAFGVFWSGFPFGIDLTDNKVLLALIFWLFPYIGAIKGRLSKRSVIIAWVAMFIVFLIPHSLLGSELKYTNSTKG
ncbi:MAG: hypothetical protein J7L62_07625 [Candidatus Aminicenantes bacterium]|nr:hypothetical protein [Candidatus Aminicenantes bacterium]